ncbi:hypothetical protein DFH06DRAFT_1240473, partial [Mycena polygramma]
MERDGTLDKGTHLHFSFFFPYLCSLPFFPLFLSLCLFIYFCLPLPSSFRFPPPLMPCLTRSDSPDSHVRRWTHPCLCLVHDTSCVRAAQSSLADSTLGHAFALGSWGDGARVPCGHRHISTPSYARHPWSRREFDHPHKLQGGLVLPSRSSASHEL